jgi:hypothetical protein
MPKPLIKSAAPAAPAAPAPAPTPPKVEVKPEPKTEAPAPKAEASAAPKAPAPKVAKQESKPKPPPPPKETRVVSPGRDIPEPSGSFAPPTQEQRAATQKAAVRQQPQYNLPAAPRPPTGPSQESIEGEYIPPAGTALAENESAFELTPYLEAVKRVEQLRRERKIGPDAAGVGPIPALPWQTEQTRPAYLSRSSIPANPKGIDESEMGRRRSIRPIPGEIQFPTKEALDRPLQAALELQDIDRRWKENIAQSEKATRAQVALEKELQAARQKADQLAVTRPDLTSSQRAALAREMLRPVQANLETLAMSQRRRTQIRAALEASRREYGMLPEEEAAAPTEAPPTE